MTATTYQLSCKHTVIFNGDAAAGDVILCTRCNHPATITQGRAAPPRRAIPHLNPTAPGYQLMRELLDATSPWRNRR